MKSGKTDWRPQSEIHCNSSEAKQHKMQSQRCSFKSSEKKPKKTG